MVIAIFPLIAAVVGLLVLAFAEKPKVVDIGRALMLAGFVALLIAASGPAFKI